MEDAQAKLYREKMRKLSVFLMCFIFFSPWPVFAQAVKKPAAGAYIIEYSASGNKTVSKENQDSGPGPLRIIYSDGTHILIPNEQGKDSENGKVIAQTSFNDILVAKDKQTLGWLAGYMICAQSYDCAPDLVIYRSGRIIRTINAPYGVIQDWQFLKNGDQVVILTGFPHGDDKGEYELYDVETGRKLASYSLRKNAPEWVQNFLFHDD